MPKIIRVDEETIEDGETHWEWQDKHDGAEWISHREGDDSICIRDSIGQIADIYSLDIPLLVKALVLAYKHIEGRDIVL